MKTGSSVLTALPLSLALAASFSGAADAKAPAPKTRHHEPSAHAAKKHGTHPVPHLKKAEAKAHKSAPTTAKKTPAPARTKIGLMTYLDSGDIVGGAAGENNSHVRFNPASMTKIMTLYILLTKIESGEIRPDEILKIPHPELISNTNKKQYGDAFPNEGNVIKGKTFHAVTRADAGNIFKAIVVSSSNLACIAVANRFSGNESAFARVMTATAISLGAKNTNFKNASGFPRAGEVKDHYTTAHDLMIMMKALNGVIERLKPLYPGMFEGITEPAVKLQGYDKNGLVKYETPTHSKLLEKGSLHVNGIYLLKTAWSGPSGAGQAYLRKVTSGGKTYDIGYIVGGFDTIPQREDWVKQKSDAMPAMIAQDEMRKPGRAVETAAEEETVRVIHLDKLDLGRAADKPAKDSDFPAFPIEILGLAALGAFALRGRFRIRAERPGQDSDIPELTDKIETAPVRQTIRFGSAAPV